MEPFVEMLAVGGRSNSLGRAAEVVAAVHVDPRRLTELFDCIGADDAWVRMRAVDSLEKVARDDPGLVKPLVERIFTELCLSGQASIQWHVAQLLTLLRLSEHQSARAVDWLRDRLEDPEVDWIVAAHAMTALRVLEAAGAVGAAEVDALCRVQLGHRSASVRRKAAAHLARG